jgi:hypothetical protein
MIDFTVESKRSTMFMHTAARKVLSITCFGIAGILVACSSNTSESLPASSDGGVLNASKYLLGLDTRLETASYRQSAVKHIAGKPALGLFVTDAAVGDVVILSNKTWKEIGTLETGLDGPDGDWVDAFGNLYVTSVLNSRVLEYHPGKVEPSRVYSAGLVAPGNVTTNSAGSYVYVSDYNMGKPGFVNIYKHGSNTITKQCSLPGPAEGVALDSHDNVYATYINPGNYGSIMQFPKGSCVGTALPITTTGYPGSIVTDAKNDLIFIDQGGGSESTRFADVDIAAPPYSQISNQFALHTAFKVCLNKRNTRLFVSEPGSLYFSAGVDVFSYPSGQLITTLNSSNDLNQPVGVADFPEQQE